MPVKKYTIVDGETAQSPTLQQEIQAVSDYEDWENPFSSGVRTLIGSNFMWPAINTCTYKQYEQHQIDL